jgi:hypothetical protein
VEPDFSVQADRRWRLQPLSRTPGACLCDDDPGYRGLDSQKQLLENAVPRFDDLIVVPRRRKLYSWSKRFISKPGTQGTTEASRSLSQRFRSPLIQNSKMNSMQIMVLTPNSPA